VGASSLDSVTFNCLNQSKLVSTALCVYFVFGVRQSLTQTLALGGLLVAGAILQEGGGVASGAEKDADQTRAKVAGVAAVLAASALSGVASAATQFSLQRLRRTSTALTVEMAVAAIPCLLLAHYVKARDVSDFSDNGGFFRGWTALTLVPVLSSALGGIFVGQITKRLGGVAKGFALLLVVSCTYAHTQFPPASTSTTREKKKQ
jgi:UDP-sugar transporter A1/2/3